jgi:hypothetical protein
MRMRDGCKASWHALAASRTQRSTFTAISEFDFRHSHRVALGINDGEPADLAINGAVGKRLTYRQPN